MAQNRGTTVVTLGRDALRETHGTRFLRAVRKAVAGEYDVLGELGRGSESTIVYLARELATGHLVALRFIPGDGTAHDAGEMWLEVLRRLDESVPAAGTTCARCGRPPRGWGRFCSQCGADLSGVEPGSGAHTSPEELLRSVKEAARGRYEVLGQMSRADGGGIVYFARDLRTDAITALRLQKQAGAAAGTEQYRLGATQVIRSVAASLGAAHGASTGVADAPARSGAPSPAPAPGVRLETEVGAHPVAATASATTARAWPLDRRTLTTALAGAAMVLVLVAGARLLLRTRATPPAPLASIEAAALPADTGAPAAALPRIDSAEVQIGVVLPLGARVTVDGTRVSGRVLRLPAGSYTFRVTAPRHLPATQQLVLRPGQTTVWTPQLAPERARGERGAAAASPSPKHGPAVAARSSPPPPPARDVGPPRVEAPTPPAATVATVATVATTPPGPSAAPLPDASAVPASCASLFAALEWTRARTACEREATQGSVAAQRTLATLHDRGLGVAQNPATAVRWYRQAAESGDRLAQYRLAMLLREGRGVKRDERAAVPWLQRAAEQGDVNAQEALARTYEKGTGVKKDAREAFGWYLLAARQGSVAAALRAADYLARGEGTARDDGEAAHWLRKAADQGDADARYRLGDLYARGRGVPRSEADAVRWFELAAAAGNADARKALKRIHR